MMELDFLHSFSTRMNVIASANVFLVKVANSVRFNEYFSSEELLNISWASMCYLHEKTLTKEGITLSELAQFIGIVSVEMYDRELEEEVSKEIARFLLLEVGLNGGELLEVKTYDFAKKTPVLKPVKLIEDSIDKKGINRYKLSNQGSEFMFRTNEVEQHLQISMKQIYTKELIKRREFNHAYTIARELLESCMYQIQEIEAFKLRLRANILNVDINEYGEKVQKIFNTLEEQKKEYDIISEMMIECEKEFMSLGYYDKKIESFKKVQRLLECIIREHDSVYLKRFELSDEYDEAIYSLMEVSMNKRYDLKEDILNPIISGGSIESLLGLLAPLLGVHQPRHININKLYQPQLIMEERKEEKAEYKEIEEDTTAIEKSNKEKERIKLLYIEMVGEMISFGIKKEGSVYKVSELIGELKRKRSKILKSSNLSLFFKVITLLHTNESYDCKDLLNDAKNLDVTFNLASVFKKVVENNSEFRIVRSISVMNGEETFVYSQIVDDSNREEHTITDFEIKIDI